MTQEETIINLENLIALFHTASEQSKMVDYSKIIETLEFAAAALLPISREQVEKVWPGCPYCKEGIYSDFAYDKMCRSQDGIYCKFCGKPMTDEAVDMVMERVEALYGQKV